MNGISQGMKYCTVLVLVLLLTGCTTRPQPLYSWGSYQSVVYKLDEEDPGHQIDVLNADIQKADAEERHVAPGVHAHLGMLYSHSGHDALAIEHFEIEKTLFPEATTFMDLLISHLVRDGKE